MNDFEIKRAGHHCKARIQKGVLEEFCQFGGSPKYLEYLKNELSRRRLAEKKIRKSHFEKISKGACRLRQLLSKSGVDISIKYPPTKKKVGLNRSLGYNDKKHPIVAVLEDLQNNADKKIFSPNISDKSVVKISSEVQYLKHLLFQAGIDAATKYVLPPRGSKNPAYPLERWPTGTPAVVLLENLVNIGKTENPQWYYDMYGGILHKHRIPADYGRNVLLNLPEGRNIRNKGRVVVTPELYFIVPGLAAYTELLSGSPKWLWIKKWLGSIGLKCPNGYYWWRDNIKAITPEKYINLIGPLKEGLSASMRAYPNWYWRVYKKRPDDYRDLVLEKYKWVPLNWFGQTGAMLQNYREASVRPVAKGKRKSK